MGIVAQWREALLAQKVLLGLTTGYKNHPQLDRFKASSDPIGAIGLFLASVHVASVDRDYNFDISKIVKVSFLTIPVTTGQIEYEKKFLLTKLKNRGDSVRYKLLKKIDDPYLLTNNVFEIVDGPIEQWEREKKYDV
jgi:hypothetical protein